MSAVLNSILNGVNAFFVNKEIRRSIINPASKVFLIYVSTFILSCIGTLLFLYYSGYSSSIIGALLSFSGSLLFILLVPLLFSFLYFSFGCDRYYYTIAESVFGSSKAGILAGTTSDSLMKKTTKIIIIAVLMICMLVLSFFMPFLSFFLGGLIFSADVLSHSLSYLGLSYYEQGCFLFRNLFRVALFGIIGVAASLFPFALLIIYPLGVAAGSFLIQKIIDKELNAQTLGAVKV